MSENFTKRVRYSNGYSFTQRYTFEAAAKKDEMILILDELKNSWEDEVVGIDIDANMATAILFLEPTYINDVSDILNVRAHEKIYKLDPYM